MTAVETPTAGLSNQQLALLYQYTVEAYKTFQKLAENLPNPMSAMVFKQFAADERANRDLIEMKILATTGDRIRVTLGADMIFSEILEGEMSYRESAEFLISRERTMQRKLREMMSEAAASDRFLLIHLEGNKRAHMVELERELELIKADLDWWKREDAEWRIVHGSAEG
jgi:hypothetical protein